jgi:uncharacterized protein (TIGR01370 family)
MPAISSYALQYLNVNFASVSSSFFDLFITEGAPLPKSGSLPAITDAQVAALRAQGRTVVGYVNVSVTDDNRGYWNPAWTNNGLDTGTPVSGAPSWLIGQPANTFGRIANFNDAGWQTIVINQAKALVQRGYDGVFLDDVGRYFDLGNDPASRQVLANQMANFVALIASEIRMINPNAYVVTNADPYLTTNVTPDSAGAAARAAYLQAVDAHLLENNNAAAIAQTQNSLPGEQLLFLFSNGNPAISLAQAWALGVPYYPPSANYDALGSVVGRQTAGDDTIVGGSGPNFLQGLAGNDVLSGGDGNDVLSGGAGNDTLIAGAGANELYGGTGNDIFVVQNRSDTIVEYLGEGIDEVQTTAGVYDLNVSANLENLTFTGGSASFVGIGNAADNLITGGSGTNIISAGAGNDTIVVSSSGNELVGGAGDDVYVVVSRSDTIVEFGGGGSDTVRTTATTYVLRNNVENLVFTGTGAFTGVGTDADNNIITGGAGADTLSGLGGNDILIGGSGADLLIGGAGSDQFRYAGGESGYDRIIDFASGIDKIALNGVAFAHTATIAFVTGTAATSTNSTLLYDPNTGILSYDADGSGAGAAVQLAQLNTGISLTTADFIFY